MGRRNKPEAKYVRTEFVRIGGKITHGVIHYSDGSTVTTGWKINLGE